MAETKILLVDDDEVVRYSLCKILEQDGFAVTTAANVPEALKHIHSTVFDVLLTDLHMPSGEARDLRFTSLHYVLSAPSAAACAIRRTPD